jgi:hypothetical protein
MSQSPHRANICFAMWLRHTLIAFKACNLGIPEQRDQ